MGWITFLQRFFEALTPSTYEWCYLEIDPRKWNQVKVSSLLWVLIQYDSYPYKKKLSCKERGTQWERQVTTKPKNGEMQVQAKVC